MKRRVVACMGTVFSFDVREPGVDDAALDEAIGWLHRVDETFSTYRADSAISRLRRGEWTVGDCDAEVVEVLDACERLHDETRGYFSAYADGALDPSGYVKGWAIERASDILQAAGSANHCVNGGGDVQCVGDAQPGQPWRIGIAHPLRLGDLAGVVVGTGVAVATSGTAERGTHVIDPHSGRPADALASVTVVGPRLAQADAYATAAFAMGAAAADWLQTLPEHHALLVGLDGATWSSSGWGRAA